jgi:hypothetical protein
VTATVDDVARAYIWGYPLVATWRTRAAQGGTGCGMVARDRLSTPGDRTVVAPNNDTLYASGWFDLRAGDLTVDVGAMDADRYWSVMLLDAYTHVAYVCRRLHGSDGTRVRVRYDPAALPETAAAPDVLSIGTPTVWVLARVLVDGPDDLDAARAAQARIRVHQRAGGAAPPARPERSPGGGGFFGRLRDALAVDPPAAWHPPPPARLQALLRDLPREAVLADGVREGEARMARHLGVDRRRNGWGTRSRGADFGADTAYRAAFAKVSLAGHLPAENRSYSRRFDGSGAATLRFPAGGEPPVAGFWSLCLYGPDLFFVANEIDRYSIGDRTPGLRRDDDGGLTITVGHDRPAAGGNWLPARAGPCVLVLRAYEGRAEVVAAEWFPPDMTIGDAAAGGADEAEV